MIRFPFPLSRRALAGAGFAAAVTISTAAAATYHRLAVTSATGSEGAAAFVQATANGGALQGEVASSANTAIKLPFGVLGEYNAPASSAVFGIGVAGISTTGYGVAGESLSAQPSVLGLAGGSGVGVEGSTPANSSATAVYGEALGTGDGGQFYGDAGGNGLYAQANAGADAIYAFTSSTGDGIFTYSQHGFGLEVNNPNDDGVHSAVESSNASGVVGINNAAGAGTYGVSVDGFGLEGVDLATASPAPSAPPYTYGGTVSESTNGPGVYGVSLHNTGTAVQFESGVPASNFAGIFGFANDGPGVYGYSFSDNGALIESGGYNATLAVVSNYSGQGYEISAADGSNDKTAAINFSVDRSGNVNNVGTINSVTRNPHADVATYAAQQTESTVEDLGSAQLVGGIANVRIADDFRSTTDGSGRYMVFLTPYGDNNGLYVSSRTAGGFTVREAHGGRATLAFDYRIVAHPYATVRDERLPHVGRRMVDAAKRVREGGFAPHFDGAVPARKIAPSHVRHPSATPARAPMPRDLR